MNLNLIVFSPTHTSRTIALGIARGTGIRKIHIYDVTHHEEPDICVGADELTIVALPVYGGHVAPEALRRMGGIKGNGGPAVAVTLYGNRHYEQAPAELAAWLSDHGLRVIAAGAFVGEHSYSTQQTPIAPGRPDADDMNFAQKFGAAIMEKLASSPTPATVNVSTMGQPEHNDTAMTRFRQTVAEWMRQGVEMPSAPLTDRTRCDGCGYCVERCPMNAIDARHPADTNAELCIKCCACVKWCLSKARSFPTPFAPLLAENFGTRKENIILL